MTTFTGGNGNDTLTGGAGDDSIDGGKGIDHMIGSTGDDLYYVDNAKDEITERDGEGADEVWTTVSYVLPEYVEAALLASGKPGTTLIGNLLHNTLAGNEKDNLLDGGGADDIMIGGAGNDTYIVDNAGDVVAEGGKGGNDTVRSSVSYDLTKGLEAGQEIENLILTGSGTVNATGNALDNKLTGNDADNLLDGGVGADALAGGKGNDTYYVDNGADKITEAAHQGDNDAVFSTVDFSLAKIANIEALYLIGGALDGTGNSANNELYGNGLANTLDGGKGADKMLGGDGDDIYIIDNAGDRIVEYDTFGSGVDTARTWISLDHLDANVDNIEILGSGAINVIGNALNNTITGNAGKNIIDGGKGDDALSGGKGDDTYYVDSIHDGVNEDPNGGKDTIVSSVSYVLSQNVENLTITGTATSAIGNLSDNTLTGNDGNNILSGGGGKDTMIGGNGDDEYHVDNAGDKIVEGVGGGHDVVYSTVDFSLATFANVEDLHLTGTNQTGTGNALANHIYGTGGDDVLDGGKGDDTLAGGGGNDTYYVDSLNDVVQEATNGGVDAVISTIDLGKAISGVEAYLFNTSIGVHFTTSDVGTIVLGGSGKDEITGGDGFDVLNGGKGADTLTGGAGSDHYVIDNAGDKVIEDKNGGDHDWVESTISIADLFADVEGAQLDGTASLNLTGNKLDNALEGNAGKNTILGGDGDDIIWGMGGNDTLSGGSGVDQFSFNLNTPPHTNEGHDTIKDYVNAEDLLDFTVADVNQDGAFNLDDLLNGITKIVDHGAGKDVDINFSNGAELTLVGIGVTAGTTFGGDHLTQVVLSGHIDAHQ